MVTGVRGKVGGVIFSANAGGPYVKTWARGANPRSVKQASERQLLGAQGSAWDGLTDAQRNDWDNYAAAAPQEKFNTLGESYFASGNNWFTALNVYQGQAGLSAVTAAPVVANPAFPAIVSLAIEVDPASAIVTIVAGTYEPDFRPVFFISKRRRNTTKNPGNQRFLEVQANPLAIDTTLDILSAMLDLYGALEEDTRYFLASSSQDPANGQRGGEVQDFTDSIP